MGETGRRLGRGAIRGAALAAGLLALECGLLALGWAPWAGVAAHAPVHPGFTALLLAAQTGLGAAIGAAAAGLARKRRAAPLRPGRGLAWLAPSLAAAAAAGFLLHAPPSPRLPEPPRAVAPRPPVVLVTLDTVRADHLSVYGYPRDTSPRLEAFAKTATLYRRAIASSDLTLSTHASLFTGLYARHHGARLDPRRGATGLPERFVTLAEILHDAGYLTLAVVGNPSYLAARWGFDQGFDHYDARRPLAFPPPASPHWLGALLLRALEPDPDRAAAYRPAEEITAEALGLLERVRRREQPFLLFVNYLDPHWPYRPPPPFDARFPGRLPGGREVPFDLLRAARAQARTPPDEVIRHLTSQYDGEIAYADSQLGALFDGLRGMGLFDRSLVVVTSDHGEALGEHAHFEHGVSVYQDQVHVPLLIKRPGQREPEQVDALVSTVDVLPTVLEALELTLPPDLEGRSLLAGPPPEDRAVMSESYPSPLLYAEHPRYRRVARAVFAGRFKLIASSNGRRELYDLGSDPAERRDAYRADGVGPQLEARLGDWLRARPAVSGAKLELDAGAREQLRALGYLP